MSAAPGGGRQGARSLFLQSVGHRPLHACQLPAGPQLMRAFETALDGTGPAVLPLAPGLPAPRLRTLIAELRPDALVTTEGTIALDDGREGTDVPAAQVDEDTALVIATSGTTGRPKGVELSAASLLHSARATLSRLGAGQGDRWLACLPPDHVAGAQILVRSIVAGTEPIYPPSPEGFDVEAASRGGAAFVSLVPTMLGRMLTAGADLSVFRGILLGGAAISPSSVRRAEDAGGTVITTYGMTETCGGCVYDGVPLAGVSADIAEDERIRLAGATLFTGYRLRPDLTVASMDGEWLLTGDLGEWADGRLRVRGRTDDVIITGGCNVAAGEVANLLEDHPGVAEAAVVGRPDPEWGERVVAVVVPRDPDTPPTLDDLRKHVRRLAPAEHAPREVDIVASIPLLSSGKPDREALRRGVVS